LENFGRKWQVGKSLAGNMHTIRAGAQMAHIQPAQEAKMSKTRLLHVFVVLALAAVALLTAQSAVATSSLATGSAPAVCALPSVNTGSIQAGWDDQYGMMVIRSGAGATGVDGGLLAILGEARSCTG
jgi:hypothetical protein